MQGSEVQPAAEPLAMQDGASALLLKGARCPPSSFVPKIIPWAEASSLPPAHRTVGWPQGRL